MPRIASRSSLDKNLNDTDLVLLILLPDDTGAAAAIHDLAVDKVTQPWRVTLLVTDRGLLAAAETRAWQAGAGRYAVLGTDEQDARVVTDTGDLTDLLLADGTPSVLKIRQAFTTGELA